MKNYGQWVISDEELLTKKQFMISPLFKSIYAFNQHCE